MGGFLRPKQVADWTRQERNRAKAAAMKCLQGVGIAGTDVTERKAVIMTWRREMTEEERRKLPVHPDRRRAFKDGLVPVIA